MDLVFQPSWEYSFCDKLRIPDIAAKLFWNWEISICLGSSEFCEVVVILLPMKWFIQETQLA